MSIKKFLLFFLYSFFFVFFFKKIFKLKKNNKEIIVGVSANFYPFEFFEKKELKGFDIDLINLLSEKTGMNFLIKEMSFDSLILDLINGNIDLVISAITETKDRRKSILFSKPYFYGDAIIAISLKKNKLDSLSDLKDKEIVINDGYSYEKDLIESGKILNFSIKKLYSLAEALADLKNEKSYCFIASISSLAKILNSSDEFNILNLSEINFLNFESYSIAFSKKNFELLEILNIALDELHENGEIEKLKNKWRI